MAYSSVNVSVEVPTENQIHEITYDGQEIYQTPLTLSEHLTKLAQKIDFSQEDEDEPPGTPDVDKGDDDVSSVKEAAPFQPSMWPWDSVRTKLRNASTELSVLYDVLNIAKEKRYLVLDAVQQDPPDPRPAVQVASKKKALAGAASVLVTGAERLRNSQTEIARNRVVPDFHIELLRLRQNWRLKKVGNAVVGDLSYRTAGSHYWQSGVFEVTKADTDAGQHTPSPPLSPALVPQTRSTSALRVTVPSELEGIAYINVVIQKDQETLCNASVSLPGVAPGGAGSETHWQQRLEAAQNVLFCKELFAQLAREAVALQAPIPHLVVGNQITASLFPGIQLIIGLCHGAGSGEKKISMPPPVRPDHNHVLEHSLHQLLREVHHRNLPSAITHPSTAPLGVMKRRRLAGPLATDRHDLLQMAKSETLLEQIIKQAQHVVLRLRTMYVIDTLAREIRDPLIVSHWNALTSATQSCVKLNIITHGYDSVWRTSLVIHVGERTLKCVCRDGRVMHMSYEPQELRDLILCQISQHQVTAVQSLSKYMGWQVLASSPHVGLGTLENLGNASSCLLASPTGDRTIAIRNSPQTGVSVSVAHAPRKDFFPGQLVRDRKWENLGGPFREVRWDRMEGRNNLNKMELLMASLTTS